MKRQYKQLAQALDNMILAIEDGIKLNKKKPLKSGLVSLMYIELERLEKIKAAQKNLEYVTDIYTVEKVINITEAQVEVLKKIVLEGYVLNKNKYQSRTYLEPHNSINVPKENVVNALTSQPFIDRFEIGDNIKYTINPKFYEEIENQLRARAKKIKIIYEE